ncbi:MAG: glycosyltransferase family 2 protein, partial [Magnetococcales bacterium]|nr:glycosyltransferase family 2 protein [Magnetococcales bacterium]
MPENSPNFLLSICIPTYNRQNELAQTLDNLKWILDVPVPIEIIVADDASADETYNVILEKARIFPHFRHYRQPGNLGMVKNTIFVLRMARGKYCVRLADDDRLIPDALLNELAFLNQHDDIVVSHGPHVVWSDVSKQDYGCSDYVGEAVHFNKAQSAGLFNLIITQQVLLENAIFRSEVYHKLLFETSVNTLFITEMRFLEYGTVRLQPVPFYVLVVQTPIQSLKPIREGVLHTQTYLDTYRTCLELSASLALSNSGMTTFNPENRLEVLDLINEFLCSRIDVAAYVAKLHSNFINSARFLQRRYLWAKTQEERDRIRALSREVVSGAAYQTMKELYSCFADARQLVLCELENPRIVQQSFQQIAPEIPTVIRTW